MGLFSSSKKKKAAAQAEAASQAAAQQARMAQEAQARAAAAQSAASASRKAADDDKARKEEKVLADIGAKKKNMKMMERAIVGFEDELNREKAAAVAANKAGKKAEAKSHLRKFKRLETRIQQYQNQLILHQQQLDALEDASLNMQAVADQKDFAQNLGEMKLDADEVDETLQDMREAMQNVNDVTMTVQADLALNKGAYDMDDAEAELDALEAELGAEAVEASPSVPQGVPSMPTPGTAAPAAAAVDPDEEEIRRLEADIAA